MTGSEITSGGAVPLALPSATGSVVGSQPGSYCGCIIAETGGTDAATVTIYDSSDGTNLDVILDRIPIAAGEIVNENYPRPGRRVLQGLWVVIVGAVEGSVFQ